VCTGLQVRLALSYRTARGPQGDRTAPDRRGDQLGCTKTEPDKDTDMERKRVTDETWCRGCGADTDGNQWCDECYWGKP
jgi:hypothetical protein